MKRFSKKLSGILLCVLLAVMFCFNAAAFSANEYGLGLSVEADSADCTTLNIKLSNSNGFDVEGVSLSCAVPDGVNVMSDGLKDPVADIGTLAAGAVSQTSFSFSVGQAQSAVLTVGADESTEKDSSAGRIVAAAVGAVLVAAAVFLGIRHRRKATAVVLVFALLVPAFGMLGVHAIGVQESRSFELEASVTLDGAEYPVVFTVGYTATSEKNSYFDIDISQNTDTDKKENAPAVTRAQTSLNGTAKADGSVKEVRYEISNSGYEDKVTGTAELDGCEWSAQTLPLREGENEIIVTAELESGETQTRVYTVNYDGGEIYKPFDFEIVSDNETVYVENVVNIYFENGTTDERIEEILSENRLVRIGESNGILLVQARANVETLDELRAICGQLTQDYSEIKLAEIEEVLEIEINAEPNDPWGATASNPVKWNEANPSGTNWSVEAVEALSAWKYEKYFAQAKVGVIDGGFYTAHEELSGLITFPEDGCLSYNNTLTVDGQRHGTHVSGIIGAKRNNGLGGSGLLNNVKIYASVYSYGESTTVGNIVNHLDALVTAGAKAVNLSMGLTAKPYGTNRSEGELMSGASQCAAAMDTLLDTGYEFVVVQSAGNGAYDSRIGTMFLYGSTSGSVPNRSIDTYQNGLFCSIRNDMKSYYYGTLTKSEVQAVYDRILVVGAVTNYYSTVDEPYLRMWHCSNGGDRVDIYAPGFNVYSSMPYDSGSGIVSRYAIASGTSQAAPIVTAIAAMCFAINSAFTGAQVKNIICDPANSTFTAYDASIIYTNGSGVEYDLHPFEGDGRVVSMKLCAEASLRYVCGKASYTYFNQAMRAVDELDPNAFTNYEVLQAVLDTIDEDFYNLYEFEQDKVTAKANEIIAAMQKLENKEPADYTQVNKAVNAANALNPGHYVDFSGVTAAVKAVVYGKYAEEQEEVDKMAQAIFGAIEALELLVELTSQSSYVIADNERLCVVTTADWTEDLSGYLSAGAWVIEHKKNSQGNYSTGSKIVLNDGEGAEVEYPVAVIGDVNGDGLCDSEDAYLVSLCAAGLSPEPQAALLPAYDADCSGTVDSEDVVLLNEVGIKENEIFNSYCPGGNG